MVEPGNTHILLARAWFPLSCTYFNLLLGHQFSRFCCMKKWQMVCLDDYVKINHNLLLELSSCHWRRTGWGRWESLAHQCFGLRSHFFWSCWDNSLSFLGLSVMMSKCRQVDEWPTQSKSDILSIHRLFQSFQKPRTTLDS